MGEWGKAWGWAQEYFRAVRPAVIRGLQPIRERAEQIPDPTLRAGALESLATKQFHCEGGGVFAGPSRDSHQQVLAFLLPYQTLCDYLDTVTDRGPSKDPENFQALHEALLDAVHPFGPLHDYYRRHPNQDDGGYLASLVTDSRSALGSFPGLNTVAPFLVRLVNLYIDLQVFKHGPPQRRVEQLTKWYLDHHGEAWGLSWWEFSAACGSTLGLFALLNVALRPHPSTAEVTALHDLYFPWLGALHILLDYYVDQEEDRQGGDLNFIAYYPSSGQAVARIRYIYDQSMAQATLLPDRDFHQYVAKGLLGFYLSDQKLRRKPSPRTCQLLASGGAISTAIYLASLVGRAP